jgi:hypothetical protein
MVRGKYDSKTFSLGELANLTMNLSQYKEASVQF